MKFFAAMTAALAGGAVFASAEPAFYCSFDNTLKAVSAKGDGKPVQNSEPQYRDGIKGKALLIGKDTELNRHGVVYSHKYLNWTEGTISFWVKPLTWKGSDTGFFVPFFSTKAGENEFLIYKYFIGESLYFMRGKLGFWLFTQYRPGEWKPGEWHHVVCIWNPVQLSMYIDGTLATERRIMFPLKDLAPLQDFTIGDTSKTIGSSWKKPYLSLIDEFKMYDRDLSRAEILELFRECDPGNPPRNLISVPFGAKKFVSTGFTDLVTGEYALIQNQYTVSYDKNALKISLKNYKDGDKVLLTSPAGQKFSFAFTGKPLAIPLASLGLEPDKDGWKINIVTGNTDLRGGARLRLDPDMPSIRIPEMFDIASNKNRFQVEACPGIRYQYDTDTSFQYGFWRITGTLDKGFSQVNRPMKDWELISLTLQRNGKDLYRTDLTVRKNLPLTVTFLYTKIGERRLMVAFQGKAKGAAVMELVRTDGSIADTQKAALPESSYNFFNLEFPIKPGPGDYTIRISYEDPNGKKQHIYTQLLRIPPKNDPVIADYHDPDEDKLPPGGWTPVKTDGNSVSVWGRKFDLGNGFFFSSLTTQGKELLAEPDKLLLDGKALKPKKVRIEKDSATQLQAIYRKEMEFEKLRTESTLTVHFDGYIDISMKVIPLAPLSVKTLELELPIRNERLVLVRDAYPLSKISGKAGDSFSVSLMNLPVLWVGDYYRGINFTAEDLRNWHWRGNAQHAAMKRDGKAARLRFRFISAPLELCKERDFRFGFVVTPVKPLNRSMLRLRAKKEIQSWFQPWKYFNTLSSRPEYLCNNFETMFRNYRKTFKEVYWYGGFVFTSPFMANWTWYEENWRQIKHNRNYGTWTGSIGEKIGYCEGCIEGKDYRNYRLNNWASFMRKDNPLLKEGTRCFYFDSAYEESCYNTKHGCKLWTDPSGKSHTKLSVGTYRDMALNVYRMIKRLGPDAKVSYHTEWGRPLPCHSFNDYMMGGEGQEHAVAANNGYYDILTPASFAVTYSPYIYNVKMAIIPQVKRGLQINAPVKYRSYDIRKPIWRKAHLHYMGLAAVHDTDIEFVDGLSRTWWKAQDALGWNDKTVFHPYFADEPAIRTTPVSDRIVASAYTNNGNLMLAILNDTDEEKEVTVTLDLKKMGVKKGLTGSDVWDSASKYTLDSKVKLIMPPRGFRLINFLQKR